MDAMLTRRSTAKQSKKAISFQYPTTALHNIAYLFQIIEDKHLLLAAIQHPVVSAEQPGAMLKRFMDAWKKEEESAAHQNRRQISQPMTAKRAAARWAAHEARRRFARAENKLGH